MPPRGRHVKPGYVPFPQLITLTYGGRATRKRIAVFVQDAVLTCVREATCQVTQWCWQSEQECSVMLSAQML